MRSCHPYKILKRASINNSLRPSSNIGAQRRLIRNQKMRGSYARRQKEVESIRRKKMRDRMIAHSNESLIIMQYALMTAHEMVKQATTITRATKNHFAPLDWNVFYRHNRTHIRRVLRMTKRSFDRLTEKLEPFLRRKGHHQRISPKLRLYVYLRWLAGVPYTAICDLTGISSGTCYRLIDQVCVDIISCKVPEVDNIHFPQTTEQVKKSSGRIPIHQSQRRTTKRCVGN